MPKRGPDVKKINLIRNVLKKNPHGLWVREIARKAGLDKSTVSRYLATYMAGEVDDTQQDFKIDFIKAVKLRRQ